MLSSTFNLPTVSSIRVFSLALMAGAVMMLMGLTGAAPAVADGPVWNARGAVAPANLPPGGEGVVIVTVTNLGDATVTASSADPVRISATLPEGVTATSIGQDETALDGLGRGPLEVNCELASLSCEGNGEMLTYNLVEIVIHVSVAGNAHSGAVGISVSGDGAPPVSVSDPVSVSSAPTGFGLERFEMQPLNADGTLDTQAGSHPFQYTTTLMFTEGLAEQDVSLNPEDGTEMVAAPLALPKDLKFDLPPGLVGNPAAVPQCPTGEFQVSGEIFSKCPTDTQVGVVTLILSSHGTELADYARQPWFEVAPVYNLEPSIGEPARFGFLAPTVGTAIPVFLDTSIRTGSDYGVVVTVHNINQVVSFVGSQVSFWGNPGDPRHNPARGLCVFGICEGEPIGLKQVPFLTLPPSCTGLSNPYTASMTATTWAQPTTPIPGTYMLHEGNGGPVGMDGCNRLPFDPSINLTPDNQDGSTPTGLTVGVHVPQDAALNPTGLAEANVKDTTVALPEGVVLNPAAADGLSACSLEQISLETPGTPTCPDASKVATVEIHTPLLPEPLVGAVYLAAQNANPFGSLVALYIVAEDKKAGVLVKLAGEVHSDGQTGQLVSTFKDTPQLPFEDLKLHFFGGDRAPLATPGLCGSYTTTAFIAPWSGNPPVDSSSTFQITSGPNGSACSSPLPFAPSFTAGMTNIQTGAFSPFTMTMSREDGQQNLKAVQLRTPPGLLGTLSSVKLCEEPQADLGTCGPESLIGETIVSVGLGGSPFSVKGGKVYITGPYHNAPFGLSIVNPAKAGPYDLGQVIVRAKIEVDPITAALTVTTDTSGPYAIPQILDGIPLQIKHVNVTIDRPNFTFNPTNCSKMEIGGSLTSDQGASSVLQVPFQVTNCATLAFKPQFKVSTAGKTSRANGASLNVKLAYPKAPWGSQADIKAVKVDLPKQLPSRLTTLQKACPDSVFNQNPASCPAASRIGTASATTPIIPVGLSGPAYFVSHGGAKFPELIIVLSGYGVTVQLHGETFISPAGITSSTFRTVPDVPIGGFELKLPQGKGSALAANGNLCKTKLKMPTLFTAQNGAVIHQSTPIGVTGCGKTKKKSKKVSRGRKE
jgi:hypothetical protein